MVEGDKMVEIVEWLRFQFGEWIMRVALLAVLFTMGMNGITTAWALQNILADDYNFAINVWVLLLTIISMVMMGSYLMDRWGFVGRSNESLMMRNKYFVQLVKDVAEIKGKLK